MIELKNKVLSFEATKEVWRKNHRSIEWIAATKLNLFLFGMHLNNTPKCECLEDLFRYIKSKNINQKIKSKMSKEFILTPKKVLQTSKFGVITEASSDDTCMRLLNAYPVNAKHFKSLPENWEQKCADFVGKKAASVEVKEETTEETTEIDQAEESIDLDSMKVGELKKYIASKEVAIPDGNKAALLEFAKTL